MRLNEALDIVADHVAAELLDDGTEAIERQPDQVGSNDWTDLLNRLRHKIKYPARAEYEQAMALLKDRSVLQ